MDQLSILLDAHCWEKDKSRANILTFFKVLNMIYPWTLKFTTYYRYGHLVSFIYIWFILTSIRYDLIIENGSINWLWTNYAYLLFLVNMKWSVSSTRINNLSFLKTALHMADRSFYYLSNYAGFYISGFSLFFLSFSFLTSKMDIETPLCEQVSILFPHKRCSKYKLFLTFYSACSVM